jgi:uncharacterized protein YecE (DUF72 family)
MAKILIGTSSWADRELTAGGFYPADIKTPEDRLRYYASHFPLTEIDSSYHYLPTRRNLALWTENTPAGFTFDIKAFSLFTGHPTPLTSFPRDLRDDMGETGGNGHHLYVNKLPEKTVDILWERYTASINALASAGKLGLIMFQFPPWFHSKPENYDYISHCKEKLKPYSIGVEFRTGGWLNEERQAKTLEFLRQQAISLVCVDEPQDCKTCLPPLAEVTAPVAAVRFHGRNGENWEKKDTLPEEKFNYLYNETELKEWVAKIEEMAKKAEAVHITFKNKHQDYPVRNARQMMELLGIKSKVSL